MGMTLTPIGSIDPQNQPAAQKVASSLWSHSGSGLRTAPTATGGAIAHVGPSSSASAAAATGSNPPATASNEITSNDFLTLLVTEMQNQDPTQPTDPNAYIQQLVGVNSLQQLIAINNDLTPTPPATPTTGAAAGSVPAISAASIATSGPTSSLYPSQS